MAIISTFVISTICSTLIRFFVVLYIAVCLVLGIFLHVVLELELEHVCVYFGSFERPEEYGVCESAEKENEQIMESLLNIDFCGINECLVSENAG